MSQPGPRGLLQAGRLPTTRAIVLSLAERRDLETLPAAARDPRLAVRAQMILLRADGVSVLAIARRLRVDRNSVWRWCDRYLASGVPGLHDLPRSGRPRAGRR